MVPEVRGDAADGYRMDIMFTIANSRVWFLFILL